MLVEIEPQHKYSEPFVKIQVLSLSAIKELFVQL